MDHLLTGYSRNSAVIRCMAYLGAISRTGIGAVPSNPAGICTLKIDGPNPGNSLRRQGRDLAEDGGVVLDRVHEML